MPRGSPKCTNILEQLAKARGTEVMDRWKDQNKVSKVIARRELFVHLHEMITSYLSEKG